MKAGVMRDLADQLVGSINRTIHESRESLEARIRSTDTTVGHLHERINKLEKQLAELQERLTVRRVA